MKKIIVVIMISIPLFVAGFLRMQKPLSGEPVEIINTAHANERYILSNSSAINAKRPPLSNDISAHELREQRVKQGLQNFMEKTKDISKESIDKERRKIAQGLLYAQQKPTELPVVSKFTDENGDSWKRLQFSDGIVRYMPE